MLLDESGHYGGRPKRPSRLLQKLTDLFKNSVSPFALAAATTLT